MARTIARREDVLHRAAAQGIEVDEAFARTVEALGRVEDTQVPGSAGSIPVRIYRPDAAPPLPLVLYAHGGGWVTGSLDSHDRLCRILARSLPAVLVAVGYRCAPEHVYPAALDDFEAAWRWARGGATS